ncbi:MAG: hypothetical protein HYZ40_20340 [Rhodospirillales bacterium]|nr:hypothetical protein [Rhodospirillales bacterium]
MVTISPSVRMRAPPPRQVLDFGFLRRTFLAVGLVLLVVVPFSHDPLAFAVGCFVPWVVLTLLGTPTMPVGVVFFFVWQWAQTFARILQSMVDGEPLAGSFYGPGVFNAYWYMLASIVTMAVAFRLVLGNLPRPMPADASAHLEWRPLDLFLLYCGTLVLAVACSYASRLIPGLGQQFEAVSRLKIVAEFLLFVTVLGTGRGGKLMLAAVLVEIVIGFSGLLSDFRGVFIYLAMAAIAARIAVGPTAILGGVVWFSILLALGLFWTAVKNEYRDFATGGEETQAFSVPLSERFAYLGALALSPGDIDWRHASYAMLARFAYVDIFGSVIDVQDTLRGTDGARQWQEAFDHVFKPRFFFPDKAALSDTETYARLTGTDPHLVLRASTSISVGYIAENYVDFGFPGMLASIFGIGLMIAGVCRYFMRSRLPWMVRQGIVLAFLYNIAGPGVEASLPKLFGSTVMFFLVYALLVKFALPIGLKWLDTRASTEPPQPS